MTNFGKGKRLITTLISVLLCMLTAFSVLGVNLKLKNNQEKETTQTQAATNLDSEIWGNFNKFDTPGGPSYDDYDAEHLNLDEFDTSGEYSDLWDKMDFINGKKYFHIYSWKGLVNFRTISNWDVSAVNKRCTFKGQEVYLWGDITIPSGNHWIPIGTSLTNEGANHIIVDGNHKFEGSFYGNGYTFSGFYDYIKGCYNSEPNYGMFAYLQNAKVYNLKVKDFTCEDWAGRQEWLYGGGIAGRAESSIIKNCIVENYKFELKSAPNGNYAHSYIGGIVGESANTTIEDCLVSNIGILLNKGHNENTAESNFCSFGPAISFNGGNSLINVCVRDRWRGQKLKNQDAAYWGCTFNDYSDWGVSADNVQNDEDPKMAKENLNAANAERWHAPTDGLSFNNFPYLKSFLKFKYYTFTAGENGTLVAPNNLNGSKAASIKSELSVEVPQDNTSFAFSSDSTSQTVYGVTVTATPQFGWKCVGWEKVDDFTYKAVYERTHANVTFKPLQIQDGNNTLSWAPHLLGDEAYGLEDCKGRTNDVVLSVEIYSEISFSVTAHSVVCLIKYPSGTQKMVRYMLNKSYIFSEENPTPEQTRINNLWNIYCPDVNSVNGSKVTEDKTIKPKLKFKSYGVGVG